MTELSLRGFQMLSKPENCCGLKESEVLSLLNDVGTSSVLPFFRPVLGGVPPRGKPGAFCPRLWDPVSAQKQDHPQRPEAREHRAAGYQRKGKLSVCGLAPRPEETLPRSFLFLSWFTRSSTWATPKTWTRAACAPPLSERCSTW